MRDRIASVSATCKWKAHIRSKITKLNVKVRSKLAAINILTEEEFNAEMEGRVYLPLTFQHFDDGVFPWEESNQGSFREDFKLDCWMLLKRNEEQPGQSMKELSQFMHSLKKNIESHRTEIYDLIQKNRNLQRQQDNSFDQAQVAIKSAEIRRLQVVGLLNNALKYSKYFQHLNEADYEDILSDEEFDGEEEDDSDEMDNELDDIPN